MSTTFPLRQKFVEIAMLDVGKVEASNNRAPWINKLWEATSYSNGMADRAKYCAAGMAYCLKQWVQYDAVRKALNLPTMADAEKWRCKSASVMSDEHSWLNWAKAKGLQILPKDCVLHAGDLVIYTYSHIEMVADDDGTETGPFVAVGYNTNAAGDRDGEGCFRKPRGRAGVKCFIRILP